VKVAWEKLGAVPVAMKPAEYGAFVQSEIDRWAQVIKTNDIKVE
jgi:tripartite-type tricarboxylate transporter receptor subunit TctC